MRKKLTNMKFIFIIFAIIIAGCGTSTASADSVGPGSNQNTTDQSADHPSKQPAENPAVSEKPAEITPVWIGKKKDMMYEYYLMFTSKKDVYVLEMVDDEVERIEKGTYSIDGKDIHFDGITMIEKADINESGKMISAVMSLASLLYYFTPSDMEPYDKATLASLMETRGVGLPKDNKRPRKNDDGTYSYYVSDFELRSTINIWDYVNGEDFDLYKLLRDYGYEFEPQEYINQQTGEVYRYKYVSLATNGNKKIYLTPQNPWQDRFINEKGLASFKRYMPSPALYIFYPSHEDMAEALYSVNGTDIGVSIDQMIFISCMIDYNAQGGLGDADFVDLLLNNGGYIPKKKLITNKAEIILSKSIINICKGTHWSVMIHESLSSAYYILSIISQNHLYFHL